jgi:cytochrome o ubiquinol oxidase subunit IV
MSQSVNPGSNEQHGAITLHGYVTGFAVSIFLTITAYLLVTNHAFAKPVLVIAVIVLALTQFITQLVYFLHLGRETKPRWKLLVFLLMVMVVLILVFGSLWIMTNLNYNMSPQQMQTYMQNQDGL